MNSEMMKEWFDEETPVDSATVEQLDKYIESYAEQRQRADDAEERASEENKKLSKMEAKILEYLEALGRTSYDAPIGKFTRETRYSVKLPQGEAKAEFFEYLKEKGVFEDMVHVNSKTLQTFYRTEMENHADVPGWKVPGCDTPTGQTIVKFKPNKKKG